MGALLGILEPSLGGCPTPPLGNFPKLAPRLYRIPIEEGSPMGVL